MSSTPPAERELRTLSQAAQERPFLTLRWLRQLVAEHRIPSYKLGGKVLVDLAELDAFIEASRRGPQPEKASA